MKFMEERKKIIKTISKMQEAGLIKNTSGNVSIKIDQNILITPSGKSYDELKAEDLLLLDKDKNVIEGELYLLQRQIFIIHFITIMTRLNL